MFPLLVVEYQTMQKQTFLHEVRKRLPGYSQQPQEAEYTTEPIIKSPEEIAQASARHASMFRNLSHVAFVGAGVVGMLGIKTIADHLGAPFDTAQLPPLYDVWYQMSRVAHAITETGAGQTLLVAAGLGAVGYTANDYSREIDAESTAEQQQDSCTSQAAQELIHTITGQADYGNDGSQEDARYSDREPLTPYVAGYQQQQP